MTDEVPPPPSGSGGNPPWADDPDAEAEVRHWPNEDALKGQERKNQLLWLRLYGLVVAGLILFFAIAFVASLATWLVHYITPWGSRSFGPRDQRDLAIRS